MSISSSQRNNRKKRRQLQKMRAIILWLAVAGVAVGLTAVLVWNVVRPAVGEEFALEESTHVSEGSDPGSYSTNPPTSGPHFSTPLDAGFYEESDLQEIGPFPQGHLVHDLEHGYIVFWYNCDLLDGTECEDLKLEIRAYIDSSLITKLIALPWAGNDVPLVLTSWGYSLDLYLFDERQASNFISANRLRAPEPNAQYRDLGKL